MPYGATPGTAVAVQEMNWRQRSRFIPVQLPILRLLCRKAVLLRAGNSVLAPNQGDERYTRNRAPHDPHVVCARPFLHKVRISDEENHRNAFRTV